MKVLDLDKDYFSETPVVDILEECEERPLRCCDKDFQGKVKKRN
ncbi:MAG: hypothetical protein SOU03_09430 [Dorea sp.]|nr:hypothetical protein [Dorea sp.]